MIKTNLPKLITALGLAALFLFCLAFYREALASTPPININAPVTSIASTGGSKDSIIYYFCLIARWWLSFTMILSIIFGVWAGWRMIQKGEKGLDEGARHMIQYSLIGVAIGLVALGLPRIAADFFEQGSNVPVCSFTGGGTPTANPSP